MKLKSLKLINYRNCENITFDFTKPKVLIIGKNAQGKTNILEAIYLLSTMKSPRTSIFFDFIKFQTPFFRIETIITKSSTDVELSFSYSEDKKKNFLINGVKSTQKDFKSILKTVLFSTKDLLLLRGAPEDRRDWLDNAISQIYPAYDERLTKYDKIRTQKNNFLKDSAKSGAFNEQLLDVYNKQLSVTGSNIIYIRKKYLHEIEEIAKFKHKIISDTEELKIHYENSFLESNGEVEPIEYIQSKFEQSLIERREEEKRRCQACVGPHRDDISFFINDLPATKFASQGQQRTVVLALKLSELDLITERIGESPILLLDDVLAELDDLRQNYLLKSINKNTMTIITSVDTLLFEEEFLKDVEIYTIENGTLK